MELFIPDLFEVLKCRVKKVTDKRASQDPAAIVAGVADIQKCIDEIKSKAEQQALEMDKLRD